MYAWYVYVFHVSTQIDYMCMTKSKNKMYKFQVRDKLVDYCSKVYAKTINRKKKF